MTKDTAKKRPEDALDAYNRNASRLARAAKYTTAIAMFIFGVIGIVAENPWDSIAPIAFAYWPALCIYLRWHYRSEGTQTPFPTFVRIFLPICFLLMFFGVLASLAVLKLAFDKYPDGLLNIFRSISCATFMAGFFGHIFGPSGFIVGKELIRRSRNRSQS